ncbi:MAG: alpha/beta fold hydrolase [Actinomycetota bacterium]|nr:alpha/beta fold hydrolase [Actinomycetota bacterium]
MNYVKASYGTDSSQYFEFIDAVEGDNEGSTSVRKVAVLIHGGFWRGTYDLSLMKELGYFLKPSVDALYNIEYRRLSGGGGWPTTFEDVISAVNEIFEDLDRRFDFSDPIDVFIVGHSAGGHLAALAASYFSKQSIPAKFYGISLGGVLDLEIGFKQRIGDGVVGDFLGVTNDPSAELLSASSPRHRLSGDEFMLVITGGQDTVVPASIATSFIERAIELGVDLEFADFPGEDHMDLIATTSSSIAKVVEYITKR